MKYLKRIISLFLFFSVFSFAQGAGAINAKVIEVRVDEDGKGIVVFDSPIVGTPPACAVASYNNALAIDIATAGGKAAYALALLAKQSGGSVYAVGRGTCNIYGASLEDLHSATLLR